MLSCHHNSIFGPCCYNRVETDCTIGFTSVSPASCNFHFWVRIALAHFPRTDESWLLAHAYMTALKLTVFGFTLIAPASYSLWIWARIDCFGLLSGWWITTVGPYYYVRVETNCSWLHISVFIHINPVKSPYPCHHLPHHMSYCCGCLFPHFILIIMYSSLSHPHHLIFIFSSFLSYHCCCLVLLVSSSSYYLCCCILIISSLSHLHHLIIIFVPSALSHPCHLVVHIIPFMSFQHPCHHLSHQLILVILSLPSLEWPVILSSSSHLHHHLCIIMLPSSSHHLVLIFLLIIIPISSILISSPSTHLHHHFLIISSSSSYSYFF